MDADSISIVVEEKSFKVKEALAVFIQSLFSTQGQIPLHAPFISQNEVESIQKEVQKGLFSTSSPTIDLFEQQLSDYIGIQYVVATNSGTSALHLSLLLSGVQSGDLVITQATSFVATANTIVYCGAKPVFLDVSLDTCSLSPESLHDFLEEECVVKNNVCIHKKTGKTVRACIPVHTFGYPAEIDTISEILKSKNIHLIEDAAQAFGSEYKKQKCGSFGRFGCFSFNGNKIITTGSGGALVCKNEDDFFKAKQLVNQGKESMGYHYFHSVIGYNYKMSGLSAAIGIQQLKKIDQILLGKQRLASSYRDYFNSHNLKTFTEPSNGNSNNWLNNVFVHNQKERDELILYLNHQKIEARPLWWPLHQLPMFLDSISDDCENTMQVTNQIVSLPSGSLFR